MTEKEKMLKQMLYDAGNDKDLIRERTICKTYVMNIISCALLKQKNRKN